MMIAAVTLLATGFTLAAPTQEASASGSNGWGYFHTSDGKWDGTVTTTRTNKYVVVDVDVSSLRYKTSSSGGAGLASHHNLAVRLCSASTGNCTGYSGFAQKGNNYNARAVFSNMIPGTYRLDIKDYYNPGFVYGDTAYWSASHGNWY